VPTSSYTPTDTTTDDDDEEEEEEEEEEEDDDDEDNDEDDSVVVDLYSTHLSLSQGARERAVKHVLAFAKQGKGVMQVVTGDLNAEPQEKALQFLRGDAELPAGAGDAEAAVAEGGGGGGEEEAAGNKQGAKGETSSSTVTGDFVDAWLAAGHSEPLPRSSDLWEVEHALTFPSCNAVKRIDFVLARSNPNYEDGCGGGDGGGGGGGEGTSGRGAAAAAAAAVVPPPPRYSKPVRVLACEVVGQAPNLATAGYTPREGLGMGDADSPVWASDHRAVVATLELPERFRSNNNNHVAR
jgi:endonuclease/exonuclease/phosphatase family metal-dependent hydrolase